MSDDVNVDDNTAQWIATAVRESVQLASDRYPGDPMGPDKAMCDLLVYTCLTDVVERCGNDLNALRMFQGGVCALRDRVVAEFGVEIGGES